MALGQIVPDHSRDSFRLVFVDPKEFVIGLTRTLEPARHFRRKGRCLDRMNPGLRGCGAC